MLDKKNMVPCIDWFRGIVPEQNVFYFVKGLAKLDARLEFKNFVCDGRAKLNFKNCWRHTEVPSLSFSFNPEYESLSCLTASDTHNNKGILFELSGDAIRYLGSDALQKVLVYLHGLNCKCTRIDYALDFFDKDNEIVPLMQEGCRNFMNPKTRDITVSGKIKRCPSNWQMYINAYPGADETVNFTLGNHGSDHGMFRLYDKKFELLYGRHRSRAAEMLAGRDYWYRAELELHNGKDIPWANESFHNLVINNFQLYSLIGHTFDMWFSFRILVYSNRTEFNSISLWEEFISELKSTIHFVQSVVEKFVPRDESHAWVQIQHNSTWLSYLNDIGSLDPERLSNILNEGRARRLSESKYRLKYGYVDNRLFNIV